MKREVSMYFSKKIKVGFEGFEMRVYFYLGLGRGRTVVWLGVWVVGVGKVFWVGGEDVWAVVVGRG